MLFYLRRFYIGLARQAPQTNEIRRSSVMISVSHYLVELYWLTRIVYEVGASAGLDRILDYYGMEVAAEYFGARDPLLILTPDSKGPTLPNSPFQKSKEAASILIRWILTEQEIFLV